MPGSDLQPSHITTTETLLRFYVFLGQYIDRCVDDTMRQSPPEHEFQKFLTDTHSQIVDLLDKNQVVKNKAETEFQHITTLCEQFLKNPTDSGTKTSLQRENEVLKIKMLALSDLLAVFRST